MSDITDDEIRSLRDLCTFALGEAPCRSCGKFHVAEADCPAYWEHHHRIRRCRDICADMLREKKP